MSLEEFRDKEKLYAICGISTSSISFEINECIEELIKNGIEDSKRKLKIKYSNANPGEIDGVLDKMKDNYLRSAEKWSQEITEFNKNEFKLPVNMDEDSSPREATVDQNIEAYRCRLLAIKMLREELAKVEQEFTGESDEMVLDELERVKASTMQVKSDLANICDLFASINGLETNGLEESVGNMIIE